MDRPCKLGEERELAGVVRQGGALRDHANHALRHAWFGTRGHIGVTRGRIVVTRGRIVVTRGRIVVTWRRFALSGLAR
eukprot:366243-Rhodomonas_salina.1